MIKKIKCIIYMGLYINSILSGSTLTPQEINLYNKIITIYKQAPYDTEETEKKIVQLLAQENISVETMCVIIKNQIHFLEQEYDKINYAYSKKIHMPSAIPGTGLFMPLISLASFALSISLFTMGVGINHYLAPSTMRKITYYGLNTIGGITLIPGIGIEAMGEGFITLGLAIAYDKITHTSEKKSKLLVERANAMQLYDLLQRLKQKRIIE